MDVTKETIEALAGLAKIGLSEAESLRFARDLSCMAAFADKLAELDVSGVAATTHSIDLQGAYRADEMIPSLPRDELLANAPGHDGACFLTPKVLDQA